MTTITLISAKLNWADKPPIIFTYKGDNIRNKKAIKILETCKIALGDTKPNIDYIYKQIDKAIKLIR